MIKMIGLSLAAIAISLTSHIALADETIGKKIYEQACAACHTNGVAGAPKIGDLDAWSVRISKGSEALYISAINGIGAMPAKGGQIAIPDPEIKAAVDYMISNSSKL